MYKLHPREKRAFGSAVEQATAQFLMHHGLVLLHRNFACRSGEIDLIMRDNDALVFVEVRYRRSLTHGSACATVNWRKQRRIVLTAQFFLNTQGLAGRCPCRFDVVGASPDVNTGRMHFDWIRDAFPAI